MYVYIYNIVLFCQCLTTSIYCSFRYAYDRFEPVSERFLLQGERKKSADGPARRRRGVLRQPAGTCVMSC